MTAEVIVMNKQAVSLAADSAATVIYYNDATREREKRYFKGSNKIFHISTDHPVGLMLNGSLELLDVPWEILIKDFKHNQGSKQNPNLEGYIADFFSYIDEHPLLNKEKDHSDIAGGLVMTFMKYFEVEKAARDSDLAKTPDQCFAESISSVTTQHEGVLEYLEFDDQKINSLVKEYSEISREIIDSFMNPKGPLSALRDVVLDDINNFHLLVKTAIIVTIYTRNTETGLIFSGFGKDDYYPSFQDYRCHGYILGHLVIKKKNQVNIGEGINAAIEPFAISSMINTFRLGFGDDLILESKRILSKSLDDYRERITSGIQGPFRDTDADREEVIESFRKELEDIMLMRHNKPLLNVIENLPLDDMGNLAETLINLESLKERVTAPSESVSGPIDVAIITKSDGFIWIKRKHYFNPELNPRYLERLNPVSMKRSKRRKTKISPTPKGGKP